LDEAGTSGRPLDRHWAASAAGDQDAEHEIYHDDAVCEYPQSGEGYPRAGVTSQALRSHHPGRPSGFAGPACRRRGQSLGQPSM